MLSNTIISISKRHPMGFPLVLMSLSCFLLWQSIDSLYPKPEVVTHYRFTVIEKRIRNHLTVDPTRPVLLDKLEPIDNEDNAVVDGWDYMIRYRKVAPNTHELMSLGQDNLPGGKVDLFYQFTVF